MHDAQHRTWDSHWREGKWGKNNQPSLTEILDALEMMMQPLPAQPDAMGGAPVSWTLREHSRFVEGLKIYPDGPYERIVDRVRTKNYSDVKSYGFRCWQFISRQRACDEDNPVDVKVERTPLINNKLFLKNWHRVRNWFKSTLKWCIEVLSFQCLRAQEHAANDPVDRFPVQHRRSVLPPKNRDSSCFYGPAIPIGGPATRWYGAISKQDKRGRNELYETGVVAADPRRGVYLTSAYPTDLEEEDDDDWIMRSARRAASEIDWTTSEPVLLSLPMASQVQSHGAWSTDEHERYCEGVRLFRYGSWKSIADHVGTRTVTQVISHAQSVRAKRRRTEERNKRRLSGNKASQSRDLKPIPRPESSSIFTSKNNNATMQTPEELLFASVKRPLPIITDTPSIVAKTTGAAAPTDVDQLLVGELGGDSSVTLNERNDAKSGPKRKEPIESLQLYSDAPFSFPPLDISITDEGLLELLDVIPAGGVTE